MAVLDNATVRTDAGDIHVFFDEEEGMWDAEGGKINVSQMRAYMRRNATIGSPITLAIMYIEGQHPEATVLDVVDTPLPPDAIP